MSWTQTKSWSRSPLPTKPDNMVKNEFIALDRGLLKHPSKVISWRCLRAAPGADASAFHGRLGARVALLQSPILPVAELLYQEKKLFHNLPVDKPHTCNPWFSSRSPQSGNMTTDCTDGTDGAIFVIRVIRNAWFQLLFLGLIPIKSQASPNSVCAPVFAPKNLRCAH